MKNIPYLIIRPPSEDSPYTEWLDNGQVERSDVQDILLQLSGLAGARNVSLLLPASWLTCCCFPLPQPGLIPTQQAIAWQVEDKLVSNSETLHWTVAGEQDGLCYVLGIERQKLALLVDGYRQHGLTITAIIPDGCYLPIQENGWSALRLENGWLVRHSEFCWSYLNTTLLFQLAERFTPGIPLLCYGDSAEEIPAKMLPGESPLLWYARKFSAPPLNLLHGEFRPNPPAHPVLPLWRKGIVGFATAAVLAYFCIQMGTIWHLHQRQKAERLALQERWQQYFPGDKRQGNYRFFFRQKVTTPAPDPLTRLRQVEKSLQPAPGIALAHFSATKETAELKIIVQTSDFSVLEQFVDQSKATLNLTLPQPSNDGVYTLRSGGTR